MDDGHIEVLAFDNRDLAQILSHTRSHKGRQLDTTLWREHSVGAAPKLLECSGVHYSINSNMEYYLVFGKSIPYSSFHFMK